MYVCWTWFKPINCKSKKSINLNSSQCEAWLQRYSKSIYPTTCSLLLHDGKMMTKRSLVYNTYNSYCRVYFWSEPKCLPAFSQSQKMTSAAHLWQEPFQLYPSVISEFLRAGSYSRRWLLGSRDRAAGQGQSYCNGNASVSLHPAQIWATSRDHKQSARQTLVHQKNTKDKRKEKPTHMRVQTLQTRLLNSMEYFTREYQLFSLSLCLKGEGRGESGCWEKHRPEKIHFNLPNARAGLLTFSNWYFPWNSIGCLHNFIIKPHLIASDYAQHDCSHREI